MTDLFQATREHDLPPRWDGAAVEWGPWREPPVVFACDRSRKKQVTREVCGHCDADAAQLMATGRTTDRTALTAFRCPVCGHDTVFCMDTGEWWDLDPTDYQDAGSVAP